MQPIVPRVAKHRREDYNMFIINENHRFTLRRALALILIYGVFGLVLLLA